MSRKNTKVSRRTATRKLIRKPAPHSFLNTILKSATESGATHVTGWDTHKTLEENYKTLGLCVRLNGATGGSGTSAAKQDGDGDRYHDIAFESKLEDFNEMDGGFVKAEGAVKLKSAGVRKGIHSVVQQSVVQEARILRDADGNITGYEVMDAEHAEPVNEPTPKTDENPFIKAMEDYIAKHSGSVKRWVSEGELLFLCECTRKYGRDYDKMARDLKLNRMQMTAKQIERKMDRFRKEVSMLIPQE